ncbi:terminase small subunit [Desulfovibrio legallii]|jgi:phage terminase small subunit|uniref:terminase small subunit n=1 Tax=Desulfovibrio legallii TaxID=571438 RepID=UPI000E4BDA1F|nr:terminase small subunit [Desulfovibrio legallii]RHH25983.1 terminase small subunit [Desulfovibrio sp. AM18-2]
MAARKLTPKQAEFVRQYLVDLNATAAAIRAGYSERTAKSQGQRLLTNVDVSAALAAAKAEREQRTEITQDRVVSELAKIAFADPRELMEWGPEGVKLKDSAELTEEQAASVAEVSETTTKDGGSLRLKKHDKVKALELLGRHLGMFTDKVKSEISGGLEIKWQD